MILNSHPVDRPDQTVASPADGPGAHPLRCSLLVAARSDNGASCHRQAWSTYLVVSRSALISARQVEFLRTIADGCPDGVMTGHSYKTTAKALQGRRLVTAGLSRGAWRAELTDAGRH